MKSKLMITGLVLACASTSVLASSTYRFEPLNYDRYMQKPYVGVKFNVNLPYAKIDNTNENTGYYGLGFDTGNTYQLNDHNALGYSFGFNFNDRSSFAKNDGTLISASLYDVNALAHYQLISMNRLNLDFSLGLAYVFGWVNHYVTDYYGRFEPVVGFSVGYEFVDHLEGFVSYQHYFAVSSDSAFANHRSAPSINRISIGGRYVF